MWVLLRKTRGHKGRGGPKKAAENSNLHRGPAPCRCTSIKMLMKGGGDGNVLKKSTHKGFRVRLLSRHGVIGIRAFGHRQI